MDGVTSTKPSRWKSGGKPLRKVILWPLYVKKAAIYFCAIKKFHGKFNKLNNYYFYRLINPFASSQKGILWLFVPPIVTCEGHELINLIWKELVGFSLPSVYFHSYTLMTKQIMTERRGTLHDNCVDS